MPDAPPLKTIYRIGVETLKAKHDEMEQHLKEVAASVDDFEDIINKFEEATVWLTRYEALLMAVRDLARDNTELQSVADELCRDVPEQVLTFGLWRSP